MGKSIYIDELPKDAVQIKDSFDYIDPRGNIYGLEKRNNHHSGEFFIKKQSLSNGYLYCGINKVNGRRVSCRVNRLVANTFIPNPENYPVVIHKDNNKANNNVDNLKWGTVSENTKQAFDDGLAVNRKGFNDEQSIPVDCYDTLYNQFIGSYGSISIAAREVGMTKRGITYQLENPDNPIRKNVYFVKYNASKRIHTVIGQFDIHTDEEIARYINIGHACVETGISDSVISSQVVLDRKPKWTKTGIYFKEIEVS